jgi:hypothetical protein
MKALSSDDSTPAASKSEARDVMNDREGTIHAEIHISHALSM